MPYTDMFKDTGCRTFLKYWGGELIEFVLKQAGLGKEWEKISEIGKPYIIKAKIGFFEIDTTGRYEKLMYIMSSWYKKRMSVGGTEGFVKRNIKPNEILEIIDGSNTLEKLDKMYYELMKS